MSKLDVLIINPSALEDIYQSLTKDYVAIETPIWAALIANHVRSKNYGVAILDCEAEWLTATQAAEKVGDYDPRIVAVVVYGQQPSASTQNMYGAGKVVTAIKERYPDKKIVLIGGHCTALPQITLKQEKADFVAQGEGLQTLIGLLETKNLDDTASLKKVPGLWYRDESGTPTFTMPSQKVPQSEMANQLPGMAFDLLPMKNYRAHNWHALTNGNDRQPYASVYTSLGCPFKCSFCCINAPFGGSSFRYWNPEFMIKQFDTLANDYGVKNVKIADEMFVLKEKHFLELCKLLKQRDYGFNIWAYSRIDTAKPEHMKALKDAGVNWIVLGIESYSKFVRDGVTKGRFTDDDIPKVVDMFRDHGINVMGNYIFGLPDDDYESMQLTLDTAIELNTEWANFYSAMAYPGSQLYNMAITEGWRLPETWVGYSQHAKDCLPLPTKHLKAGEVLSYRDKAWEIYFQNPKYLNLVRDKFGQEAFNHILGMTKTKLARSNTLSIPPEYPKRPYPIDDEYRRNLKQIGVEAPAP